MIRPADPLPLELLQRNERAEIVEVDGPPEEVHRLDEMGLRPGVVFRLISPGSPCVLALDETRFSFRPSEATTVLVRPLGG